MPDVAQLWPVDGTGRPFPLRIVVDPIAFARASQRVFLIAPEGLGTLLG